MVSKEAMTNTFSESNNIVHSVTAITSPTAANFESNSFDLPSKKSKFLFVTPSEFENCNLMQSNLSLGQKPKVISIQ